MKCLVQCASCETEWVSEDDIVCKICESKINRDVAIAELHDRISFLQSCSKSDLVERKDLLKTASRKIIELIRYLEE